VRVEGLRVVVVEKRVVVGCRLCCVEVVGSQECCTTNETRSYKANRAQTRQAGSSLARKKKPATSRKKLSVRDPSFLPSAYYGPNFPSGTRVTCSMKAQSHSRFPLTKGARSSKDGREKTQSGGMGMCGVGRAPQP
jgi:hypothetical protein